jgi:hypothetical protein
VAKAAPLPVADGSWWHSELTDAAFAAATAAHGSDRKQVVLSVAAEPTGASLAPSVDEAAAAPLPLLATWWPQCLTRFVFLRLSEHLWGDNDSAKPKERRAAVVERLCLDLASFGASRGLFMYHETMTLFTVTMVHSALAADAKTAAEAGDRAGDDDRGEGAPAPAAASDGGGGAEAASPGSEGPLAAGAAPGSFAAFALAHPSLLDPRLYRTYYSDRLMCNTAAAAETFALPDVLRLPSLVA